ncbi:MAG TPA: hypothetical protein VNN76_09150 [Bacteroidota bacterium]|nr:hypothetical protein [Bacteroidota bacterium]
MNRTSIIGVGLIILGGVLLLNTLGVAYFSWKRIFWLFGLIAGGGFVVQGFARGHRGKIFWGSLLFFVSLYYNLWHWWIIDRDYLLWLPSMSIAFGLSYLVLFAYEPKNVTELIPASIFIGMGMIGILWWWEYLEWFEVEDALRTYWPLVLVAIGLALMFRRR